MMSAIAGVLSRRSIPWIGAFVVIVGVAFLWGEFRTSEARRDKAESESAQYRRIASDNAKVADALGRQMDAQSETVRELQSRIATISKSAEKRRERLKEATSNDPVSREWASQPLPDRVRSVLTDPDAADPAGPVVPSR